MKIHTGILRLFHPVLDGAQVRPHGFGQKPIFDATPDPGHQRAPDVHKDYPPSEVEVDGMAFRKRMFRILN